MDDSIGYLIVGILIIGFTFGFALQIQQVLRMRKKNEPLQKRVRYVHYVRCVAYAGFLSAYVLNIIPQTFLTDNQSNISCYLFLIILLGTYFKKSWSMQKVKL
ncbi:hypothetical protein [Peribacillus sp. NPDC097295]|uniref:hypothetical protein n=1 Tax=Peribacillus sp. NPDC097295 TaxID=3364402 RepID=UPI003825EB0B